MIKTKKIFDLLLFQNLVLSSITFSLGLIIKDFLLISFQSIYKHVLHLMAQTWDIFIE